MSTPEPSKKKNLLLELAKRKAEAQASGERVGMFGNIRGGKFSRVIKPESYIWRGGRNGSGKP